MPTQPVPPDDVPINPAKRRRDLILWAAFLGAPTIWLSHLQLIYSLALWTHRTHVKWPLYASCVVSFALCAVAGFFAWRSYRSMYKPATAPPDQAEEDRVSLMFHIAWSGIALFLLGIVAQWGAIYMINPAVD